MKRRFIFFVLLQMTYLASCKPNRGADLAAINSRPIKSSEFPAVVSLFSEIPVVGKTLCSATFVARDVLLTAAHCLVSAQKQPNSTNARIVYHTITGLNETQLATPITKENFFIADEYIKTLHRQQYADSVAHIDLEYTKNYYEDRARVDVAFIKIGDIAPELSTHFHEVRIDYPLQEQEKLTIVSFGRQTDEPPQGKPVIAKQISTVIVDTLAPGLFRTSGFSASKRFIDGQGSPRNGDSGAPVFTKDHRIVGIVSSYNNQVKTHLYPHFISAPDTPFKKLYLNAILPKPKLEP